MKETFWQRLVGGGRRLHQCPDWPGFVGADWPERIMDVAVTDRFHAKQGRSTGRWVLHAADRRLGVYLKRHYQLPWWQRLLATLWPGGGWSAALREWHNLEWATAQGFPVPRAVAAGEFIGPWGQLQSFLAVEELTGMVPLHEAIPTAAATLAPPAFRAWKNALIDEIARLARELHGRRYFHKDLYLCHFYIRSDDVTAIDFAPRPCGGEGLGVRGQAPGTASTLSTPSPLPLSTGGEGGNAWRGRVHVIDLHRLTHHPWTAPVWQVKDLAQLLYSSEIVGVDARDRLRFWRAYRGPSWLRRLILWKWQRYRRHNSKARRGS